ncbi:hypothetical protein BWZ20_04575 [Winogradskyella sp. J14-2]|nr:hypothetical protein BWZ20_04575 [Winogradskyella sp. J14-2]
MGCSDDDNGNASELNDQFIVDKIYDYNNNLLAEYFYNNNNQLIKFDRIVESQLAATYEFEYEGETVVQIDFESFQMPSFNHSIHLLYNEEGQIIKDEMHHYGSIVETNDYVYNDNGRIQEVVKFSEGITATFTYNYNGTENIEEVIALLPEFDDGGNPTGNTIEVSYEYDYDNGTKPNFGLDQIFQIEPLPGFGTLAVFEKNYSSNNMTKSHSTGTEWIYTYSENGLVETIETIWEGIETEEPILLRISYSEVN